MGEGVLCILKYGYTLGKFVEKNLPILGRVSGGHEAEVRIREPREKCRSQQKR